MFIKLLLLSLENNNLYFVDEEILCGNDEIARLF
jgi:hypothetical protein